MTIINRFTVKKIHKWLLLLFCVFSILCMIAPPVINTLADDNSEDTVKSKYSDFAGKSKTTAEVAGKVSDTGVSDRTPSFAYLFKRLIAPGYLNDVSTFKNTVKGQDTSLLTHKGNGIYLCNHNQPDNLLGYNCDIPNISAQILQSIMGVISTNGITNGQRQSAQPAFNLGVPKGIPGKNVPVSDVDKKAKYTGLELFGYNMNWSTYNGEWDDIVPSSKARLLSNYGSLDKIKLTGSSIWNGVSTGLSKYVDNAKLTDPLSWFTAIPKAAESGTSESLLTIADASDANVALTHSWTRTGNSTSNSFYRVYTLSDKQVVAASTARTAKKLVGLLNSAFAGDSTTQSLLSLQTPPTGFNYDSSKTSKEFDKKKAKVEDYNKKHPKNKKSVPTPSKEDYMTEKDQLKDWMDSNKTVQKAKDKGIDVSSATNYKEFKSQWVTEFNSKLSSFMNDTSEDSTVGKLIKKSMASLSSSDPYGNPSTAISHYVCAHKDGSPYIKNGQYVYLYTAQNSGSSEHVNPACSANLPIRPAIQGGFFGDGYNEGTTKDTRNIAYGGFSLSRLIPFIDISGTIQRFCTFLIRMITEMINEMLNLAFSPLMSQLGITKIVKVAFVDLKNSVFFPLMAIVISIAGISMLIDVIKSRSLIRFISTFAMMFVILIAAFVIFKNPNRTIDKTEEIPLQVENTISNVLLKSGTKDDNLCSSTGSRAGVRTAQCYVWKDIIFNTWTYGQFGTGYKNLYPNNSYGQSGNKKHMMNKNQDLVGDPNVELGGGQSISNWAIYQMYLMTSGTITTGDSNRTVGTTDNNLYRLVDLQAGPNNAQNSDSRYWNTWTGRNGGRAFVAILGLFLAILGLIAVGGLLITKIELTFLMSIMILALPVFLLFGLTPRGQSKLKGYLATLLSLFLKRILIVILLCTLLRVWDSSISESSSSFNLIFVATSAVLIFFIIYRPEILRLFHFDTEDLFSGSGLLSGDPNEVKRVIGNNTPRFIKNKLYEAKTRTRGITSGFIGGAFGGATGTLAQIRREAKDPEFISNDNLPRSQRFGRDIKRISKNTLKYATEGVSSGERYQHARTENFLTRNGLSRIEQLSRVKERVTDEARSKVKKGENRQQEIFNNASTRSKYGNKLAENSNLNSESMDILSRNNKVMRELAKVQNKADKIIKETNKKKDISALAVAAKKRGDNELATKLEKQIDKIQKQRALFDKLHHPIKSAMKEDDVVNLKHQQTNKAAKVATDASETVNSMDNVMQESAANDEQNSQATNVDNTEVFENPDNVSNEDKINNTSTNRATRRVNLSDKLSNSEKSDVSNSTNNLKRTITKDDLVTPESDSETVTESSANTNDLINSLSQSTKNTNNLSNSEVNVNNSEASKVIKDTVSNAASNADSETSSYGLKRTLSKSDADSIKKEMATPISSASQAQSSVSQSDNNTISNPSSSVSKMINKSTLSYSSESASQSSLVNDKSANGDLNLKRTLSKSDVDNVVDSVASPATSEATNGKSTIASPALVKKQAKSKLNHKDINDNAKDEVSRINPISKASNNKVPDTDDTLSKLTKDKNKSMKSKLNPIRNASESGSEKVHKESVDKLHKKLSTRNTKTLSKSLKQIKKPNNDMLNKGDDGSGKSKD